MLTCRNWLIELHRAAHPVPIRPYPYNGTRQDQYVRLPRDQTSLRASDSKQGRNRDPMNPNRVSEESKPFDRKKYPHLLGMLNYLLRSRPDIATAVEFMRIHRDAVFNVMKNCNFFRLFPLPLNLPLDGGWKGVQNTV